jgi:hypothetical protein
MCMGPSNGLENTLRRTRTPRGRVPTTVGPAYAPKHQAGTAGMAQPFSSRFSSLRKRQSVLSARI